MLFRMHGIMHGIMESNVNYYCTSYGAILVVVFCSNPRKLMQEVFLKRIESCMFRNLFSHMGQICFLSKAVCHDELYV